MFQANGGAIRFLRQSAQSFRHRPNGVSCLMTLRFSLQHCHHFCWFFFFHGRETALYGNIILKMGVIAEPQAQEPTGATGGGQSWENVDFFLPFQYTTVFGIPNALLMCKRRRKSRHILPLSPNDVKLHPLHQRLGIWLVCVICGSCYLVAPRL